MKMVRWIAVACCVVWVSACDERETESAEAVGSETAEESSAGDQQGASSESGKHHEAIARAVCPDGEVTRDVDYAEFGCATCPAWTVNEEPDIDDLAGLTIVVGQFTEAAAESGELEALVDVVQCGDRVHGYSHGAFLEQQDGDWRVDRHSPKIALGNCDRVAAGPHPRTSLVCMRGGPSHQGITAGTLVSYLIGPDGWRRQPLAKMKHTAPSGMGDHCVDVESTVTSVDDAEPREAEVAVRVRGRERPRTDDDPHCARLEDDDWDDDAVVRYRWNGEAFGVPDDEERAVLERTVELAEVGEVDFEGYLEPEAVEGGWEELETGHEEGAGGRGGDASAAIDAYDPSSLPEAIDVDPEAVRDEGLAWRDAGGENLLVVTRSDRELSDSNKITSVLVVAHWRKSEGGEWTFVRDFREIVEKCGLDLSLGAEVGPWSLTDLDDDGMREVSFAWSAGCVGGMDPVAHKVLVTEDGDKSILRGETRMTIPLKDRPDDVSGGEVDEVEGFDGDEERRAHADKVWEATVE